MTHLTPVPNIKQSLLVYGAAERPVADAASRDGLWAGLRAIPQATLMRGPRVCDEYDSVMVRNVSVIGEGEDAILVQGAPSWSLQACLTV